MTTRFSLKRMGSSEITSSALEASIGQGDSGYILTIREIKAVGKKLTGRVKDHELHRRAILSVPARCLEQACRLAAAGGRPLNRVTRHLTRIGKLQFLFD